MTICDSLLKTTLDTLQDYFCKYKISVDVPAEINVSLLHEYKEMLGTIRTVSIGLENLTKQLASSVKSMKAIKTQGAATNEKKNELIIIDNGKPKPPPISSLELSRDITPLAFKLISEHLTTVDLEDFHKLLNSVTEVFPVLSLKVNNMAQNKELYEHSLTLFWKLIKQPHSYIHYTEKQLVVGVPDLVPYRYPKKGDFFKRIKGNLDEDYDKKTCFHFKSKVLQNEVIRILKKLQSTSVKLFNSKNSTRAESEKQELKNFSTIRTEVLTKLSLYKIHFLSTCIHQFMTTDAFDLQSCYDKLSIKLNEFERRRLQLEYLLHWEKSIVS